MGEEGVTCFEWPAPLSGAIVMPQAELLLEAMSESMATQWQRSLSMFNIHGLYILEDMGMSPIGTAKGHHLDIHVQNWPHPPLDEVPLKSCPHLSPLIPFRRASPAPCPGNTVELALIEGGSGVDSEQGPKDMSLGEITISVV